MTGCFRPTFIATERRLGSLWLASLGRRCAVVLGALRHCTTICDTLGIVGRAISVRLDDEADKALRTLEAAGLSQSEAIRTALLSEVRYRRRSKELAAEVAALEADENDREEMLAVAELMEALRAPR